jgi:integrase
LGVATTRDLRPELVYRFLATRPAGESPHTTRSVLRTLQAVCNHAEEMGYAWSPFRLRRLRPAKLVRAAPLTGKRHCTRDEIRKVLDLMREDITAKQGWAQWRARRLLAVAATAAYLGARANEVLRLWVSDLDLHGRIVHIRPHGGRKLKTLGSEAAVGVPRALVPILSDWLEHRLDHPVGFVMPPEVPWLFPGTRRQGPWTQGAPGHRPTDRLKSVAARAGVVMTFQMLRASWATIAEGLGLSQPQISRQMRHADPATTLKHYQQREEQNLRDAVERFDFWWFD